MKLLKLMATCLLVGSHFLPLSAQIFSGGFRSNFGVDADILANILTNGTGTAAGLDDWFKLSENGTGFGFIDTSNAQTIFNFYSNAANINTVFEKRSNFGYQATFGSGANKRFIDAVFGRENFGGTNSAGNFADSTVYVIASKNGEAPSIWSPGVVNVANKNDILDIYGLCQRNGTSYSDSIYVFAGLTLNSNTGARYVDFEFFQAPVGYQGKPIAVFNDGGALEEGHTAFKFNSSGKPVKAGDMIFAVEIGSGGINVFEMRIWMRKDSFALYKANPANYPNLPFLMGGSIDGGSSRSVYGYAQIRPKDNKPFDIVAVANSGVTTPAPPWGAFFNGAYGTTYGIDQFFEIGVNLTQVGLDPLAINNDPSPCARAFSKYMIKTRASNAFTAQLQDFAGPYDFGGPPDLRLAINSTSSQLTCDSTHATLKAIVSNGHAVENYYYTWKLGSTVVAQGVGVLSYRTNVPGTYTLEVAALAGCSALATGTYVVTQDITAPAPPTGSNQIFCTGSSLKTISVNQPGAGFEANWFASSSGGTPIGNGNVFLPSAAGTYYASFKKISNGCSSARVPVTLTAAPVPVISATAKRPCSGQTNGSITTSVTGGTSTLSYSWNQGATTASLSNIGSGIYTVVVKDINLCADTLAVEVPAAAPISLSLTPSQVLCNGGNSGSVVATATGGSGTLTYVWSNAATTSTISSLTVGTYTVTVTDGVPCSVNATVTITEPAVLSASGVAADKSCSDKNDGTIDVTVSGGKSPYTFLWSNSATSEDVNGLSAGTYTVTVTDANMCTTTLSKTITGPSALFAPASVSPVACFGQATGSITVSATGGNSGYTYLWADGTTGATRNNLPAGSYVLTLKDNKNCQKDTTIVVTQPAAALALSSSVTAVGCFGESTGSIDLTVSGGTSPYTYLWSNGETTQDNLPTLAAGSYTVTVTDLNGCKANLNSVVTQPNALTVTGVITNATCTPSTRNANGSITLTVSGGTPASGGSYIYSWTGPSSFTSSTQSPTNLGIGTYNVTVKDSEMCTATWTGMIKETTPPLIMPSNIISNN